VKFADLETPFVIGEHAIASSSSGGAWKLVVDRRTVNDKIRTLITIVDCATNERLRCRKLRGTIVENVVAGAC
jgi:hypothetical protein